MGDTRSRSGILVGIAAAVGACGAAAMMSAAAAPTARADDLTDIINNVTFDFTTGQSALTTAFTDFGSNELVPGLTALFDGVDDDTVAAPDTVLIGTVEALNGESIVPSFYVDLLEPTSFAVAATDAQSLVTDALTEFEAASTGFSEGLYGGATYEDLVGGLNFFVLPLQELLLGVAASF